MKGFYGTIIGAITFVALTYVLLQKSGGLKTVTGAATVDYGQIANVFRSGPGVG